jgi:glycosyltransferase involved in cell wall biosynthesis
MNYAPNEHAIDWFAKDVWPLVRARNQAARLLVVGSDPRPQIRALAAADPSITVTGRVPDVRPYLWESAVSIAPITTSHGVQTKVLEAVAAGLPCVVTSAVSEGLPPELAAACAVADDPERYAAAIIDLLSMTPEERRRIAGGVDTSLLDWQSALADLPRILAAAAARHQ